jgi:hypothetical protein
MLSNDNLSNVPNIALICQTNFFMNLDNVVHSDTSYIAFPEGDPVVNKNSI